jgi:hypothetical protein
MKTIKTIVAIAAVLGLVAFLAAPAAAGTGVAVKFAVAHGEHGLAGNIQPVHYGHWHHGWYGGPVVVARPVVPAVVVPYAVAPPVVAYPPVYAPPPYYYGAPRAGLYYRGPGISVGVGF